MHGIRKIEKKATVTVCIAAKIVLPALLVLGLLAPAMIEASQEGDGYRVVVNKSNPVSSLSKKDLSKLFLKKTRKWGNGKKVVPIDLPQTSPTRERFSKEVHNRSIQAVRSYWRLRAFTEGDSQPPELASETEVLEYVATDPVAIGYVSRGVDLAGFGVKVLEISD